MAFAPRLNALVAIPYTQLQEFPPQTSAKSQALAKKRSTGKKTSAQRKRKSTARANNTRITCPICSKSYSRSDALKRHLRTIHDDEVVTDAEDTDSNDSHNKQIGQGAGRQIPVLIPDHDLVKGVNHKKLAKLQKRNISTRR
jgi:hypothetical protein